MMGPPSGLIFTAYMQVGCSVPAAEVTFELPDLTGVVGEEVVNERVPAAPNTHHHVTVLQQLENIRHIDVNNYNGLNHSY